MFMIDPARQSERDNYRLMIGSIIPRPIALVTTQSRYGVVNAASFSYFNIVTSNPPMVSVSVQRRNEDSKDKARNALDNDVIDIHSTDEANVKFVNQAAAHLAPNESEIAYAGLTAIPRAKMSVPGVVEAKIKLWERIAEWLRADEWDEWELDRHPERVRMEDDMIA
ncbi:NADH-FMN oxidoreductase RutF, flavin reductase (DIM6/NTAB) family [Paenibacillus sp. yr247]|uniref:flavin reductase family protein n=1 Tax=Paenibacillus sp. yr247 TaxID=1761880 RepID=UPI00088AF2A8|nr:flavin reductase family protein [Paenibacillus sp. yr247]SDN51590.1 NADH-FMN oxidoreductase RutF, flavin reductase (DIM6/NTAB) family [Paenibacillus sp. yr247]